MNTAFSQLNIPVGRISAPHRRRQSARQAATQQTRANLLGMSPEELQEYNTERESRPMTQAQYLIAEERRAEQLAQMMYEQAEMLGGQPYFGNRQQNFTTSQTTDETRNYFERQYRQTLVNANLSTLRFREIPRAIQLKMVALFKRSLMNTALLPFTFAARAGHLMFVEPIVIVVTDISGIIKRVYAYFFVIVMIFGVRHFYIHYARDNPYIETVIEFVETSFPYFIAPTKWVVNNLSFFISGAFQQIQNNASGVRNYFRNRASNVAQAAQEQIRQRTAGGVRQLAVGVARATVSGAYDMAQTGYCRSVGRYAPAILACSN